MQGRNEADPIKVLLADNHTMFREGIAERLGRLREASRSWGRRTTTRGPLSWPA